ncbi:DUF2834 domain-containing protein [Paracoccus sp. S-4012]|uniref:DUF2834 domain-containing protein n=1 Tax=Paracoccus sp. S-4012 TaxID=2665648 RepID=UPI0012B03C1D|nr:DUF2834 domain-containing protein [Paracoccus sp. S-4012]MRX49124.1 DUF2834 domain-containing protein [Paracoccus sp. S-4012]
MSAFVANSKLTPLRLFWLLAALAGAAFALLRGPLGPASAGEWVAAAVLVVWCGLETQVRRNWEALLTLPALILGTGCALPLYLFLRSRPVA